MNMIFFLFWKCPLSSPDVLTQVLFTKLGRIFFLVFIGNIHRLSSNLMEESTPYSWNKWQNFVYLKILNELRLRNDPVGLLLRLASFFFFFFFLFQVLYAGFIYSTLTNFSITAMDVKVMHKFFLLQLST